MKKIILSMAVFLIISPSMIQACGMFISSDETNVRPNQVEAVIMYDEEKGEQKTVVEIEYEVNEGDVDDFGWIMPFPNKPTVEEADEGIFEDVKEETRPKESTYEKYKERLNEMKYGLMDGKSKSTGTIDMNEGFFVEEEVVGAFDVAIIQAENPNQIYDWATDNGYVLKWEKEDLLNRYIENEWYFVLMKMNNEAREIKPMEFSFQTKEVIFPTEMMKYDKNGEINEERIIPMTIYLAVDQLMKPTMKMEYKYGEELSEYWTHSENKYIMKWTEDFSSDKLKEDLAFKVDETIEFVGNDKTTLMQWAEIAVMSILLSPILFFFKMTLALLVFGLVVSMDLYYRREKFKNDKKKFLKMLMKRIVIVWVMISMFTFLIFVV